MKLERQLKRLCVKWQKILRLQDWDIEVQVCRLVEMPSQQDNSGETQFDAEEKLALVSILHPDDYPLSAFREQDNELTIIHELLHLHFPGITIRDSQLELAINMIAGALINLNRRG